MGTGCSRSVVVVPSSDWKPDARSSASNTSTTTTGSAIRTLAEASIWNPFKLSRIEAEELLSRAEPGAFIFSHDMTSELFLSISMGKYVCHHAILTRDHGYYVGARRFTTIGDVVDYFKDHPLGETFLKQEFKSSIPKCTSQVQIRHHPDINIPCPSTFSKNEQYELLEKDQPFPTVQTSWANQSQSPKITLTSHVGLAEENVLIREDNHVFVSMEIDQVNGQANAPKKKQLTRGMAIDRADSSGEFQEAALSPLIAPRSPAVKS